MNTTLSILLDFVMVFALVMGFVYEQRLVALERRLRRAFRRWLRRHSVGAARQRLFPSGGKVYVLPEPAARRVRTMSGPRATSA